jgi:peptidoglycan/xylan/chitin deacetylase (PgdA/CDA1 family)
VSPLRQVVKVLGESLLGSAASLAFARRRLRGRRLILSYHNVIAHEAGVAIGDSSLHLSLRRFGEQLDSIAEAGFTVVGIDAPRPDALAAPEVAITFDDAYAGAISLGVPELARRALPATIFVAPGILGMPAPWWDRLALAPAGAIPASIRDRALGELAGDTARVLEAAAAHRWALQEPRPEFRIASEQELTQAVAVHPALTLGAHSWSHANLARLEAAALQRELDRPLAWLRTRFPARTVDWIAYPYGLETRDVRAAAAQAGYRGAFRVTGGWSSPADDAQGLPRCNVTPGISAAGFRARLAGTR